MAFLLFALDINSPPEQLRCQAHVLAFFPDRQGELAVIHDDFQVLVGLVQDAYPVDLSRAEGVGRKSRRLLVVLNDVNLFPVQLPDNGLHPHSLHADASAHAIHVPVLGKDGDLGPLARFARRGADHHRSVVDLRNLHLEQAGDQERYGPRDNDLGSLGGLLHLENAHADALPDLEAFELGLFPPGQPPFRFAEVHDQVRPLQALDDAVHHLADPAAVFVVNGLPFRLPDLLEDHLLGGLSGDAAEHLGRLGDADLGIQCGLRVDLEGPVQADLSQGVDNRVHHFFQRVDLDLSGFPIERGPQLLTRLVILAGSHQHGIFDRADNDLRLDALFPAQLVDDLQQQTGHPSPQSDFVGDPKGSSTTRFACSISEKSKPITC